ncbi:MAG: hypothetical protein AAGJ52_12725 [Pseudomonadota bacterium]
MTMIDQHQNTESERDKALGHALNELPPMAPPPALWSAVRTELDQRKHARRQRRFTWISASMAAAAVLAVVINVMPDPAVTPAFEAETATASVDGELIQARQLSALLESQLRQNTLGAINASSMDRLLYLENELGWLDTRLASQPNDLSLWQQRIELLGEMNRQYGVNDWQNDVRLTSI